MADARRGAGAVAVSWGTVGTAGTRGISRAIVPLGAPVCIRYIAAMLSSRVSRSFLAATAAALVLSGCATNKGKKDQSYVARDVETLYNVAKDSLDRGRYKEAAAIFDEVERQHPYSVWARRAQLMSALAIMSPSSTMNRSCRRSAFCRCTRAAARRPMPIT